MPLLPGYLPVHKEAMQQLMAKPELVQAHQEYEQRSKAGEAQAALLDELTKKTLKQLQQKMQ